MSRLRRFRLDSDLAEWIKGFINDVSECIRIKAAVQHIGFTCEPFEDLVEVVVFPAPVAHKGRAYYPAFEFSIHNMIGKFNKVSNTSWSGYLSIEGEYNGRRVWFKLFPREPKGDRITINLN